MLEIVYLQDLFTMDSPSSINFELFILPFTPTRLWLLFLLMVVFSLNKICKLRTYGDFPIVGKSNDIYGALKEGTEKVLRFNRSIMNPHHSFMFNGFYSIQSLHLPYLPRLLWSFCRSNLSTRSNLYQRLVSLQLESCIAVPLANIARWVQT